MTVLGSAIMGAGAVGGLAHLAVEALLPASAPAVGSAITLAAGAAGAVGGYFVGRDWLCA